MPPPSGSIRTVGPLILRSATLAVAVLVSSRPAVAALGGDEASIAADEAQASGASQTIVGPSYTVHEIRRSSGTVIREYIVPGGRVFAVTWRGPWLPDMRQLLGIYFDAYRRAERAKHPRHRPFVVNEAGVVVHSSGHMRSFIGDAHVTSLVPEGVRVEELP